ncbi:hypothetical protein KPL41_02335 [Clostridium gasigenes]|nr:hypothetical protein [Clostridium gasigenes]
MMNLENSIKDVIDNKLADGIVEKLISEQLEKGVLNALDHLFGSYGDVTKVIEKNVKSVMIPYLENHDYSEYITKLDSVLVDVLKHTSLDNKKILENFKELMMPNEIKTIKVSELFDKWTEYVAKNIKTDELEIDYDDGVSYEQVNVTFEVEEEEDRSWSSFKGANLVFECEKDEEMNFKIRLSRYERSSDELWDIRYESNHHMNSLRYLNDFEVFLMKLNQANTTIEIDETEGDDYITPQAEPEATFS